MRTAAWAVRFPVRVWSSQSLPRSMVNSMSCISWKCCSRRRAIAANSAAGSGISSASSAIGRVSRMPATTSSPWALTRKSPSSTFSPVVASRDMATPVAESSPTLPNTIAWTFTAVPRSWEMPVALR